MMLDSALKALIEKTVHSHHANVAKALKESGWEVEISPYYMDQNQNKAREIDIIAQRVEQVESGPARINVGELAVRLFVECKYLVADTVVWVAEKDRQSARTRVQDRTPLLRNRNGHHYISDCKKVGKLFKSTHDDAFYDALNQTLNAMVSMGHRPLAGSRRGDTSPFNLIYPVIVINSFDKLHYVDFFNVDDRGSMADNFMLEVNYAYRDRTGNDCNDYFLIDVVSLTTLPEYLEVIRSDIHICKIDIHEAAVR